MIVSMAKFAEIVGTNRTQVGRWIDTGMPAQRHGQGRSTEIDTAAALNWLLERNRRNRGQAAETLRLMKAQADYKETQVRQLRAELAPIAEFEAVMDAALEFLRQHIEPRIVEPASLVAKMDDPGQIRDMLLKRYRKMLSGVREAFEAAAS